ncbi:MAG: NAD-glutamate dehydrogenase [Acidobacteria bacterium]|nr:NAD-glutamate dehydrogenase [Acidobacteriota bacterium]
MPRTRVTHTKRWICFMTNRALFVLGLVFLCGALLPSDTWAGKREGDKFGLRVGLWPQPSFEGPLGRLIVADDIGVDTDSWEVKSERRPTDAELRDLAFAWRVVKHIKSNAIVLAKDSTLVGMGAGQPNRVTSVHLALRIAGLVNLFSGCDIVRLARRRKLPVPQVAKLYFAVGTRFRLGRLRAASGGLESETHWQKLAVAALIEEIYGHQLALTNQVLDFSDGATAPAQAIDAWIDKNHAAVERTEQLLSELRSIAVTDISMVAVASRQLRALADPRRHS